MCVRVYGVTRYVIKRAVWEFETTGPQRLPGSFLGVSLLTSSRSLVLRVACDAAPVTCGREIFTSCLHNLVAGVRFG